MTAARRSRSRARRRRQTAGGTLGVSPFGEASFSTLSLPTLGTYTLGALAVAGSLTAGSSSFEVVADLAKCNGASCKNTGAFVSSVPQKAHGTVYAGRRRLQQQRGPDHAVRRDRLPVHGRRQLARVRPDDRGPGPEHGARAARASRRRSPTSPVALLYPRADPAGPGHHQPRRRRASRSVSGRRWLDDDAVPMRRGRPEAGVRHTVHADRCHVARRTPTGAGSRTAPRSRPYAGEPLHLALRTKDGQRAAARPRPEQRTTSRQLGLQVG